MAQLNYKIAKLWGKQQGSTEKYDIDEKISFPEDKELNFQSNLTAKLTFIRLKDEISVLINNAAIDIEFTCNRCLKPVIKTVEIPAAEREFFFEEPDFITKDMEDFFYIDKKRMTIDLNEMVRQEIILHFPLIPVCSNGCKGLCIVCGQDLNLKKCKCKVQTPDGDSHQPFKNLKKLIK